jgi:hypothetical protein
MKSFLHSPLLLALFSLLFLHTSPLLGQAAPEKIKKIPFHGKIVAIDTSAQTITLNGKTARVLHLAPTTKLTDGSGNPTTFSTATVGEDVGGSYAKDASGTMTLFSLRIGAKAGSKAAASPESSALAPTPAASAPPATSSAPAPATAPATATTKAKKGSFSGKVTAVDATASTFTIKSRSFTVDSSSKVTDATGAASSLANVAVGTKVSGSYEKSADGATMTVVTLKIAK